MSFLSNLTANLPFYKKQEAFEVFFALNLGTEKITAALWTIENNKLKILDIATDSFSGEDEIIRTADRLLDAVVGEKEADPQKILFGVPDSWLSEENLKEEYLKLLRKLVKELDVTPMAYVSETNALVHFLEKEEGVPATAILVGLEEKYITVTVVRASKSDGTKVTKRSDDLGVDIEKVLLSFTSVEVLPSKILIYGQDGQSLEKTKTQLLAFSWMSALSFLHFPKIEVLKDGIETIVVCFAGASEIDPKVVYSETEKQQTLHKSGKEQVLSDFTENEEKETHSEINSDKESLGFVVGDVASQAIKEQKEETEKKETEKKLEDSNFEQAGYPIDTEDFNLVSESAVSLPIQKEQEVQIVGPLNVGFLKKIVPKKLDNLLLVTTIVTGLLLALVAAYAFLLKADIKIFVEPKVLENDTQVIADPGIKSVNEAEKKIPGQIVETEVSGSGNGGASGKKQVGEAAKGTVVIRNKSDESITLPKGTKLSSNNLSFILDLAVKIASRSAEDGTWGKATGTVAAAGIGADSNLPSNSDLAISGYSANQLIAKAEGNFSGGTSKDVTVVSSEDQQKLLAQVTSDLRKKAQQKLQEKLPDKKILEEALSEAIVKKSFNKNIGDQATNFTLTLTARYKGTAYDDKDLRTIVSKLVSVDVPDDFSLDLSDTETSADVSSVEKDGRVIFLARFKAKLIPKLNSDSIKKQIKGKLANSAIDMIKGMDNVLGAEIKLTPAMPEPLNRLPFLEKNINVEVGLK